MKGLWTWATILVLGLAWACGSAPTERRQPPRSRIPVVESKVDMSALSESARVVRLARSLVTTPYRYSGSDPSGFDCSGLITYVFDQVGRQLPRTAQSQASAGHWVAPDELASGDLVFFGDDRNKPHHVGLVVSDPGEPLTMVHSSSSRGVIETEILSNSYWLPRLSFGRRVLED